MKIRWTEPAVLDLNNIREYIARDSEHYAAQSVARIINAVEKIGMLPNIGRRVPEIENDHIREIIFHNYRIIYSIENEEKALILGIIHVARDMNKLVSHPWEVT